MSLQVRESIRHDAIARTLLYSPQLWSFFDSYVHQPNFDVASDAFNTLRDLLVSARNKPMAAEFLDTHFQQTFSKYEVGLTDRQALSPAFL